MLDLKDKWVWDFWLCRKGNNHHIFYLQAPKSLGDERLRHHNASIGHACSTDLVNWTILPEAIGPGRTGEWDDLATWTGCTIRKNENWYLFYTGVNQAENGLVQRIGVAVSEDLLHWKKYAGNPVLEADPGWYELLDPDTWHDQAWRDPWVFEKDGLFHAFITARVKKGATDGRGVIAHAISEDILNWSVQAPVTEPGCFGQLEVPQLIEVNSHSYLIFSTDQFSHSRNFLNRTGKPPVTGTACYLGETPLGPFSTQDDPWLFRDKSGTLYSGRFIETSGTGWTFMAFENYAANGDFIGRITDPFTVQKQE